MWHKPPCALNANSQGDVCSVNTINEVDADVFLPERRGVPTVRHNDPEHGKEGTIASEPDGKRSYGFIPHLTSIRVFLLFTGCSLHFKYFSVP